MYLFLNFTCAFGELIAIVGDSSDEILVNEGSPAKTEFGDELGPAVVVAQVIPVVPSSCVIVQPAGKAGAVTPSKL
jgi:hypothetical protein